MPLLSIDQKMSKGIHELVFATNNSHKLKEIKSTLGDALRILSLKDIGCFDELPETSATIRGNAIQKASYVFEKYGMNCFADDTGLEIDELKGRPGVYSSRFAGANASDSENVAKVLHEMKGIEKRAARFKTIMALITDKEQKYFEGIINGTIANETKGTGGFGYDPIFYPEGSEKTFAEMNVDEKNKISHRSLAIRQLIAYLNQAYIT